MTGMKSSTVVLSNSGHDHLCDSIFLDKKSRHSYSVAPGALVILVLLFPMACILEGLRSVLSIEDRNQFKILESQKEGLFFADLVALGFHSTKYKSTHRFF